MAEIGRIAHEKGVIFHTDAAQAVGHIPVNVRDMNIDLMSFFGSQDVRPQGDWARCTYAVSDRESGPWASCTAGGQERDIRSGTLNVPGIVGFGRAMEIATNEMEPENRRFRQWTNEMMAVFEVIGGELNGHKTERLAHNLNVCFLGIEGKAIINSVSKENCDISGAPHALPKTLRHRMSFSRLATMRAGLTHLYA